MSSSKILPTILYEYNRTSTEQIKWEYIKGDRTKDISPNIIFYTDDIEENDDIIVQQICLKDNLSDLLTKSLPTAILKNYGTTIECSNSEISSDIFMSGVNCIICKCINYMKYVLFFLY